MKHGKSKKMMLLFFFFTTIMSAYRRSLTQYARLSVSRDDRYFTTISSEKRLRWLKDEAFGNSKYKSTEFNVRRSHISNRKLQTGLKKEVVSYAKFHGSNCDEIARKQEKLLRNQQRTQSIVGTSYLRSSTTKPK